MDFIYGYFDAYYYSEDEAEKEKIVKSFIDKFWKSNPRYAKEKRKNGLCVRKPKRKDTGFVFLKSYVNNLYAKHCDKDMMKNNKKFDYDMKYFKNVINWYFKKIFKKYIPSEVYGKIKDENTIDYCYDGMGDDSYACSYICKKLKWFIANRMRNYEKKEWYGDCACGAQFKRSRKNSTKKYCKDCAYIMKSKKSMESNKRTAKGIYRRYKEVIIGNVSEVWGEDKD